MAALKQDHVSKAAAVQSQQRLPHQQTQFYRRPLPKTCIDFTSEEGKKIFKEAMEAGYMNCFFKLVAQFRTQDEPAYCGLTSLVMALNVLEIDPGRLWKGPWRWYNEDMLDCCISLELIKSKGISTEQFICLAKCNNLAVERKCVMEFESLDDLRTLVKEKMQVDDQVLIASYSRQVLEQTGSGHYSPIAGYHEGRDLVLILDTARFKYPPHWVPLSSLMEAMKTKDTETGQLRGVLTLSRSPHYIGSLLFRPSCSFVISREKNSLLPQIWTFCDKWRTWLSDQEAVPVTFDVSLAITVFVQTTLDCMKGIPMMCLVIQANASGMCDSLCCSMKCNLPPEEKKRVHCVYIKLLQDLESLKTYQLVRQSLSQKDKAEILKFVNCKDISFCEPGISQKESCVYQSCDKKGVMETECNQDCSLVSLQITAESIATMLFMAWPVNVGCDSFKTDAVDRLIREDLLVPSRHMIRNEVTSLQMKLVEVLNYHENDPVKRFIIRPLS